jgi:predicted GNAT superfamily acetyltransferase
VPKLRPLADSDVEDVLALNQANVEMLAPMDESRLHMIQAICDRFDVLEEDGAFAGFVVTFHQGAAYDSAKYSWFSERYGSFYYLDRVVLDESFRRRGLGTFMYDEIENVAAAYGRMCLEVNLTPRNDASLAFHARRGYAEVGRLHEEDHLLSMLAKTL